MKNVFGLFTVISFLLLVLTTVVFALEEGEESAFLVKTRIGGGEIVTTASAQILVDRIGNEFRLGEYFTSEDARGASIIYRPVQTPELTLTAGLGTDYQKYSRIHDEDWLIRGTLSAEGQISNVEYSARVDQFKGKLPHGQAITFDGYVAVPYGEKYLIGLSSEKTKYESPSTGPMFGCKFENGGLLQIAIHPGQNVGFTYTIKNF